MCANYNKPLIDIIWISKVLFSEFSSNPSPVVAKPIPDISTIIFCELI